MTNVGRLVRSVALVGAMALVLGACDWSMVRYGPGLTGFNPTETRIGVANVAELTQHWRGSIQDQSFEPSLVVAQGKLFITARNDDIDVFSASGNGCTGSPATCTPLWSYAGVSLNTSTPAVANGVVYSGTTGGLVAFDESGMSGCSGVPKVCDPLWQGVAPGIEGGGPFSNPTVANGIVYADYFDPPALYAFDAAGVKNCSGVPKTCDPLWIATAPLMSPLYATPAVVNGLAYVASNNGQIYVFDATGTASCSGVPTMCSPLWTTTSDGGSFTTPAVSGGIIYTTASGRMVDAYDATGSANCSGVPKTCAPLWSAKLNGSILGSPAVANGRVYVGSEYIPSGGGTPAGNAISAFDARGVTNCAGTPTVCHPLWTAATGGIEASSPSVANGIVYVGSIDKKLYAFDASGTTSCSGSPTVCSPLWTATTAGVIESSPAIANGWVYVSSNDNFVHAYTLP